MSSPCVAFGYLSAITGVMENTQRKADAYITSVSPVRTTRKVQMAAVCCGGCWDQPIVTSSRKRFDKYLLPRRRIVALGRDASLRPRPRPYISHLSIRLTALGNNTHRKHMRLGISRRRAVFLTRMRPNQALRYASDDNKSTESRESNSRPYISQQCVR